MNNIMPISFQPQNEHQQNKGGLFVCLLYKYVSKSDKWRPYKHIPQMFISKLFISTHLMDFLLLLPSF